MMATGWWHPHPEKELAAVQTMMEYILKEGQKHGFIDDHTNEEYARLQLKEKRLLQQIEESK